MRRIKSRSYSTTVPTCTIRWLGWCGATKMNRKFWSHAARIMTEKRNERYSFPYFHISARINLISYLLISCLVSKSGTGYNSQAINTKHYLLKTDYNLFSVYYCFHPERWSGIFQLHASQHESSTFWYNFTISNTWQHTAYFRLKPTAHITLFPAGSLTGFMC